MAAWSSLRTERTSVRARASQSARSKIPRSRSSHSPSVSSMSAADGAKTSKTRRPSGSSSDAAACERPELLRLVGHVEERAERDRDEGHALVDRRLAQVAEAEVEQLRDALLLGPLARHGEHARRLVDADHRDPGTGGRDRDPPGADGQLDDRAARREGLVDVELDVLGDGDRPGVVDPRDAVVERVAHGRRTT